MTLTNLARLTNTEFNELVKLVYSQCGINLTPAKKVMLEGRLNKRLRSLDMNSFKEYIAYVTSSGGMESELIQMIDVVTTNKTDFFREPHHFDFLKNSILPNFKQHNRRDFKIWSSACSTGEEPYTLAMVLEDYAQQNTTFSYKVLGSDISTQVLQKAAAAIYQEHQVLGLPLAVKQRYLLRSKDKEKPTVRIVLRLRQKIEFVRINLMDFGWNLDEQDVVFCRNVLIYFDRKTQFEVVKKLVQKIRPGGYLIIGHSESLYGFDLPIQQVKPTIFQKKQV